MTKDFEEEWGFAPDSDYEVRKTNRPVDYMTEQEIKAVNAAIMEEIERRKNEL